MKTKKKKKVSTLKEIPNIGEAISKKLNLIGIDKPEQLKGKDAIKLYQKLKKIDSKNCDPCIADVFLAAIDFMNGNPSRPWWSYTKIRKKYLSDL